MYAYKFSEENGEYQFRVECQLDPLESKAQGKDVFLMPPCCTAQPPLSPKNDFAVIFNGREWVYIEDHRQKKDEGGVPIQGTGTPFWLPTDSHYAPPRYMDKVGALPANHLLEPPPMTDEELKEARISELRRFLEETDYIGARIAEGSETIEHYAEEIELRKHWREELKELLGEDE